MQQETADAFKDPALLAYYPQHSIRDVLENVKSAETWLTPERLAVRKAGFQNQARFLKKYVDAGGKIVAWDYAVWTDTHSTRPGGAGAVLPPAVGDRAHDVGGIDDEHGPHRTDPHLRNLEKSFGRSSAAAAAS